MFLRLKQACRPLLDVTADHIEHQINSANVFQYVILEVDELVRAEVERLLTVGGAQHCFEDDFDNLLRKGQARYAISGGVLAITAMLLTWTAVLSFLPGGERARGISRPRDDRRVIPLPGAWICHKQFHNLNGSIGYR